MRHFNEWRIYFLLIIVLFIGSGIIARLFSLQILRYDFYNDLAQGQHQFYQKLFPQRGEIFIHDLKSQQEIPLAINKEFQQVYAIPRLIPEQEREDLVKQLAPLLNLDEEIIYLDEEIILNRISKKDDPYEPLKYKVDEQLAEQIKTLGAPGIRLFPETWRYYPAGSLASHLVGFVGLKEEKKLGQYGLESYYEDELKGQPGFLEGGKDMAGYWIPTLSQKLQSAQDGSRLILTIDQNIQFRVEKELEQVIKKWEAEAGTIIVMEPKTGAIRAMANWPNFNPNEYSQVEDINVFLNPSIQKIYEPGSVFKPITMAIGLDTGQITPETLYYDDGLVQIGGYTISNVDGKIYGQQTMTQVLEKSINTGAVFVQKQLEHHIFQKYVQGFGFDRVTGIDLTGEISGDISNLFIDREINFATASFGQGIAITPLELITALAAIANQGKLIRPFVVEKIIRADGTEIATQPQVVSQVISPETAVQLTRMLVSVVENGHGRPARVKGYDIAGKTGTAQVPDPEKGGYSDKTIHTFVAFAPAFEPKFIILIKLDNPYGVRFAESSVVPIFKKLAEYLFSYFEIPPS